MLTKIRRLPATAWSVLTGTETEVWVRFLLAIAGLALSFAAAVFSTVERMAGNMLATAILASLSLFLAGIVGVTTVPYLARRVVFRRVREAFDYDVTREGIVYFAFILTIGVAALNTGNNLLFIIVSLMLGAVLVSGIASAAVLRALELDVVLPAHVFAGTKAMGRMKLRNHRRWTPSFSIRVGAAKAPKKGKMKDGGKERAILERPVFFPFVGAGATVAADVDLSFARRGRYTQKTFGLSTRFPFSFFVKTMRVDLQREVIAYPSVEPTDEMLDTLPAVTGEFEAFVRGRGYDLYRIRDYVANDPVHHVDWKATAKTGDVKVREFTREDERRLRIVFDNPAPGTLSEDGYENAVRTAASLAWHFAGQDAQLTFIAPGHQSRDVFEFLRYLALVQAGSHADMLAELGSGGEYSVIITARQRGSVPTAVWSGSYVVFVSAE